jgi:hypothetical protein
MRLLSRAKSVAFEMAKKSLLGMPFGLVERISWAGHVWKIDISVFLPIALDAQYFGARHPHSPYALRKSHRWDGAANAPSGPRQGWFRR